MKIRTFACVVVLAALTLCSSGYAAEQSVESQLFEAIQFQDAPKVKELLGKGANPNHKENGRPLLVWASQLPSVEVVQALLDAKANVNAADDGIAHTPLMRAIDMQQAPVVNLLLKAKADPNAKTPQGESCLILAVKSRRPEIVKAVIDAGADIKYVTPDGYSPALVTVQDGMPESAEIIKVLGAAKAPLDISNAAYTPLSYAVEQGNRELVKALLDAGANPNAKTEGGRIPLQLALDHKEIVELLLSAKADPNLSSEGGSTPLTAAIENGANEAIEILIKAGANVNLRDGYGSSPLQVATNYQKNEIVELLKKHGATE